MTSPDPLPPYPSCYNSDRMLHRHLNHSEWTLAVIDDVIARGRLDDWKQLRDVAATRKDIQERILSIRAEISLLELICPKAACLNGATAFCCVSADGRNRFVSFPKGRAKLSEGGRSVYCLQFASVDGVDPFF